MDKEEVEGESDDEETEKEKDSDQEEVVNFFNSHHSIELLCTQPKLTFFSM